MSKPPHGCFQKIVVPQNGWFIKENPIKMDDLGVHLFLETPTYCKLSVFFSCPQTEARWFTCCLMLVTSTCGGWRIHPLVNAGLSLVVDAWCLSRPILVISETYHHPSQDAGSPVTTQDDLNIFIGPRNPELNLHLPREIWHPALRCYGSKSCTLENSNIWIPKTN